MAEVQVHGNFREAQIRASGLFTSDPGLDYTGPDDVPQGYSANPANANLPVQIKTVLGRAITKQLGDLEGHVMLADAARNHQREHVEMIVDVMVQTGSSKTSLGLVRMIFKDASYGSKIFGTLPKTDLDAIIARVKKVGLGLSKEQYKIESKNIRADIAKLSALHGCKASLQPKISTTTGQRRVQCGIKLSALMALADSWDFIDPSQYGAFELELSIESAKRK